MKLNQMIKNLHLLQLSAAELLKITEGARLHKQMSNIRFKIRTVTAEAIEILVIQNHHISGNYADANTLVMRTRELFAPFVQGRIIHPQALPYYGTEKGGAERLKDAILQFLKFQEQYRADEHLRYHKEVARIGGPFTFKGATNEEILDKWLNITEKDNGER